MLIWIGSPQAPSRSFVMLDRDGVLNADRADYIKNWHEFRFYPDALEALRLLHERRVGVILISNQSALHRGLISREDFWDVHDRMIRRIGEAGGHLLAAFYCPHRPDEGCPCRKPSPAMLLAASKLFRIPMETACMIGDRMSDMQAADRAGCRGVLLERASNGAPVPESAGTGGAGGYASHPSLLGAVSELLDPTDTRFGGS